MIKDLVAALEVVWDGIVWTIPHAIVIGGAYFLSVWLAMIFWGMVAAEKSLTSLSYTDTMLGMIGLWLAVVLLIVVLRRFAPPLQRACYPMLGCVELQKRRILRDQKPRERRLSYGVEGRNADGGGSNSPSRRRFDRTYCVLSQKYVCRNNVAFRLCSKAR